MKKILLNNISLKFAAVIVGFVTWFAVMYSLNPLSTKTFDVPVSILYSDSLTEKGWSYSVEGEATAKVNVRAKSFDMNKISVDDIYLYVDMRYLEGSAGSERRGNIQYQLRDNTIDSISLVDEYLTFNFEEIVTRDFNIDVITEGTTAENYIAMKQPTAVPEKISVRGPISEVGRIVKAAYYLKINDASEEINENGAPVLLDANGEELKDLNNITISPDTVNICLPVYQTKNVAVKAEKYIGDPATGYGVADISVDTDSIKVAGYKAVLANVVGIEIPEEVINVEGLTSTTSFSLNIRDYIDTEGVEVIGSDGIVTVTVKIEKLKQANFRLQLPDDVNICNKHSGYSYSFEDTSIYVTLAGSSKVISTIEAENIIPSIDVSALTEGEYTIPMDFILPEDTTMVGSIYVTVIVKAEEPSESSSEAPTSSEVPTESVPVITEPVETEPVETEPVPAETEPVEPPSSENDNTNEETPEESSEEASSSEIIPIETVTEAEESTAEDFEESGSEEASESIIIIETPETSNGSENDENQENSDSSEFTE